MELFKIIILAVNIALFVASLGLLIKEWIGVMYNLLFLKWYKRHIDWLIFGILWLLSAFLFANSLLIGLSI